MNFPSLLIGTLLAASGLAAVAAQPVDIQGAWARATVPGQKATGAFMTLTAADGAKLVRLESAVAGIAEVHEMKMEGDIMRMRAVQGGLDLPAGQAVELKPGGYHVMLMDLKAPVTKDSTLPLTLVFKDAKGVESKVELQVPVATKAPAHMGHANDTKMDHGMHGTAPVKKTP
ncbi:copper chaperone PCu(A)C [Rhodoferax sp. PAMC 29310]|uniref:copper chaperone PCu(A)C n=1 Tax=Rhodoferax sp. PAMC 29310 TaxID=2822760 RepID=UPI001B32C2EF|nr:copper chaperone PCu(A)C [Rhodoferax sp. PAMC 29310]